MRTCWILVLASWLLFGQSKPVVPVSEYGKWESIDFRGGELSRDGKWLAYGVQRSNGNHELRVVPLAGGKPHTAAFGQNAAFSADSQWLVYAIGMHDDQAEKLRKDKKPVRQKLGIVNLGSGELKTLENVESFALSKSGAWVAMKHYGPERPATPPAEGAPPPPDPIGTNLVVRDLAKATDQVFGSIVEFAWQDKAPLLAMTISAEGKTGNGVQLLDAAAGSVKVLDSSPAFYTRLRWRKDSQDLAVLRTRTDDAFEEETCFVLAWRNAATALRYDPSSAGFPAGMRIVKFRAPQWSEDGSVLFAGVAPWVRKEKPPEKKGDDEPSNVEIWHTADKSIIPEQKLRTAQNRQKNSLAAWHLHSGKFTVLGTDPEETILLLKDSQTAIAYDQKPFEREVIFGRPYANVAKVNLATGERTSLIQRLEFAPQSRPSPKGRYLLYLKSNHYWLLDLATGQQRNLTGSLNSAFVDLENDHTGPHKPAFGVAGWTADEKSAIVYDRYDLWELPADGSKPRRWTNGAAEEITHRHVRLDPEHDTIDPRKPVYLSLNGRWTKKTGFARIVQGTVERLLWQDRRNVNIAKAKDADVFVWMSQSFEVSPEFYTASGTLDNPKRVSETNPQQAQYLWGRPELIEYRSPQGKRLQGALYYPANYEPGKQYPMIINFYEIMSTELHRYQTLSERNPYSASVYTSLGYFVLLPDIVFRPRDPGLSIVECLSAAAKKVIGMGAVDPKRIGIMGHSWGGYGTVFTSTQTDMFAASVAGAPLTNLSSSYGEVYWNTGGPETNHVEVGQERMEVPLYEDPQAYVRNSATFQVHKMKAPLLIAHGDKDGACDLHQSIEFYNVARRAGKQAVLLVYPGENHSLRTKPNQLDYQKRIREWFGHYLKGELAPEWITKGQSHLDRQREIKRLKEAKPEKPAAGPSGL